MKEVIRQLIDLRISYQEGRIKVDAVAAEQRRRIDSFFSESYSTASLEQVAQVLATTNIPETFEYFFTKLNPDQRECIEYDLFQREKLDVPSADIRKQYAGKHPVYAVGDVRGKAFVTVKAGPGNKALQLMIGMCRYFCNSDNEGRVKKQGRFLALLTAIHKSRNPIFRVRQELAYASEHFYPVYLKLFEGKHEYYDFIHALSECSNLELWMAAENLKSLAKTLAVTGQEIVLAGDGNSYGSDALKQLMGRVANEVFGLDVDVAPATRPAWMQGRPKPPVCSAEGAGTGVELRVVSGGARGAAGEPAVPPSRPGAGPG